MNNSPFGKLSAEIRSAIWELVLGHDDPIVITQPGDPYDRNPSANRGLRMKACDNPTAINILALTETCREVRDETTKMFYYINTFILLTGLCHPRNRLIDYRSWRPVVKSNHRRYLKQGLESWLRAIGKESTKSLRDVCVHLGSYERDEDSEVYLDGYDPTLTQVLALVHAEYLQLAQKPQCVTIKFDLEVSAERIMWPGIVLPLGSTRAAERAIDKLISEKVKFIVRECEDLLRRYGFDTEQAQSTQVAKKFRGIAFALYRSSGVTNWLTREMDA